jgi:hypothetical protein
MEVYLGIIAASAVAVAFTRVYDWVEWQISQHQEREEVRDG